MSQDIAVVGMACQYPDASSPGQLWDNVLAGRRAFRQIPDERIRLADYWSADRAAPDRFYTRKAAVLEGYEFDRVRYRVPGSTYRVTDMTHWLALDTAARALDDAGFPEGEGLPREATAVIVGNTLTGEFARANLMRLRWPYVRRTVAAVLRDLNWEADATASFLSDVESRYKEPFPEIDEDSLAGSLSNTIAGRICNYFDLHGGGFTVDGACSSSLLAVLTACNALRDHQADTAIVGGVDLSIDPFEVVGFAKTSALADTDMRVYDKHSNGFWPGEGCGMLVLLRGEDARRRGLRRYATIAGWGMSSDGKGGITRPESGGQLLALSRAYGSAGFSASTVGYFEGHGTGTAVGDATELRVLAAARGEEETGAPPAAIGTVKGNIGHTKAAAGVAGLIKTILAVHHEVIPPGTSHIDPHPELTGPRPAIRVPSTAEPWPAGRPVRAGVSAMGFGGINTHIVVTGASSATGENPDPETLAIVNGRQDCELLLFDASSHAELHNRVAAIASLAPRLSFAELSDIAATLARAVGGGHLRAAVVVASPDEAAQRLETLVTAIDKLTRQEATSSTGVLSPSRGVFLGTGPGPGRIGYLFPGQGAGKTAGGGFLARRFTPARELHTAMPVPGDRDIVATSVAQPRIVVSSMAGLRVLRDLGITAHAAAGHSLGELTALHWAGAMDEDTLYELARTRGTAMEELGSGHGAMAALTAPPDAIAPLLAREPVVIAGYNSPRQTVVSGPTAAVARVCDTAAGQEIEATRLAVSHAFHSPEVAPAATRLGAYMSSIELRSPCRTVISTVTGQALKPETDLRRLLLTQVTEPVRFAEAALRLAADCDLLIEVGPGRGLSQLAAVASPGVSAVSLDSDSDSASGLLTVTAAAFAVGAPVRLGELFHGRLTRPFPLDKTFRFLSSPCESAPVADPAEFQLGIGEAARTPARGEPDAAGSASDVPRPGRNSKESSDPGGTGQTSLDVLRRLIADRAELPPEAIGPQTRPLDELHLSSITLGEIASQAAREVGVAPLTMTSGYTTATVEEIAAALEEMADTQLPGDVGHAEREPAGVAPWVGGFTVELTEAPALPVPSASADGEWQVFSSPGHPLVGPVSEALMQAGLGGGVLLCLARDCSVNDAGLMLGAARAALARPAPSRFVVVQDDQGAAGLAKTAHLEAPAVVTTLVVAPLSPGMDEAAATATASRITADVAATTGFSEIHYDEAGHRRIPLLRPGRAAGEARDPMPLRPGDVLLATGGGKGITAECALALARESGVALAILGRSSPSQDTELAASLSRLDALGVKHAYVQADVTSASQVRAAVTEIAAMLGPVTAVLHGAGRNTPAAIRDLTADSFAATLAPKIEGLGNILSAVQPASLKLLVTFGSIIGRAGLRGQADYAVANDWLTIATRRFAARHPDCRCLALEWSVWSGAGMGERLGVVESLAREGITPISVDQGIRLLLRAITDPGRPDSLVVTGRTGGLPTVAFESRELPLGRFTDLPRVSYPGTELVTEAELSLTNDPYLADHCLDGDMLVPAVIGMEAMAQVATALLPVGPVGVTIENAEFLRPVVVPANGATTIRVAALTTGDRADAVIRSSGTDFGADHFRATFRFTSTQPPGAESSPAVPAGDTGSVPRIPINPATDLYGDVLFQGDRFQRVSGYRRLTATSCTADIAASDSGSWFGGFLPRTLTLGDAGARDAFMHAIQCCVPDATLLPIAVERLQIFAPDAPGPFIMTAAERSREGEAYTYDLTVTDPRGRVTEKWTGLRLQAVSRRNGAGPWPTALVGAYLEGQLAELLPAPPRCVTEPSDGKEGRRAETATAIERILGRAARVVYRADGKPEVAGAEARVSASHAPRVTFAVSARLPVSCDVEIVRDRSGQDWRELLGGAAPDGLAATIQHEAGDEPAIAATRVWGALECLLKAGQATAGPLVFEGSPKPGWVLLRSGHAWIASFVTRLKSTENQFVFTVMEEGEAQ